MRFVPSYFAALLSNYNKYASTTATNGVRSTVELRALKGGKQGKMFVLEHVMENTLLIYLIKQTIPHCSTNANCYLIGGGVDAER